jgi:hypothetical protein
MINGQYQANTKRHVRTYCSMRYFIRRYWCTSGTDNDPCHCFCQCLITTHNVYVNDKVVLSCNVISSYMLNQWRYYPKDVMSQMNNSSMHEDTVMYSTRSNWINILKITCVLLPWIADKMISHSLKIATFVHISKQNLTSMWNISGATNVMSKQCNHPYGGDSMLPI